MRSPADLVAGNIYEITNPKIHFYAYSDVGWFFPKTTEREDNLLFLFIENDKGRAKFLVRGEILGIKHGSLRHMRLAACNKR